MRLLQTHCIYGGLIPSTGQDKAVLALKGKEVASWSGGVVVSPGQLRPAPSRVAGTLVYCKLCHLHTHTHTHHGQIQWLSELHSNLGP